MVAISREAGAPTLKHMRDAREQEKLSGVRALPLVRAALDLFPGADIIAVRSADHDLGIVQAGADDVSYNDQASNDDDV
jgi:DNA polymerase III subunit gamma/tau